MSCLGRTSTLSLKFYLANKIYSQKFYSILYPMNHTFRCKHDREKCTSIRKPIHTQKRQFSLQSIQSFSDSLYENVTSSAASKLVTDVLIQFHDVTGLPWWGTIIATAAVSRLCVGLPCGLYQNHITAKLHLAKIELDAIAKDLKEKILLDARRGKWTKRKAQLHMIREVKQHWNVLVVKNNCHPFKNIILGLIQIPVWLLLSLSLRKYSSDVHSGTTDELVAEMQFQVGGVFWSPNLVLPDSTLILPALISFAGLAILEVNTLSGTHVLNFMSKIMINILRTVSVLSFFISANMPSCVSLFWATSVLFGLAQNLIFLSPKVRRFCRIPKTPKEIERPYIHVLERFTEKWTSLGRRCLSLFTRK